MKTFFYGSAPTHLCVIFLCLGLYGVSHADTFNVIENAGTNNQTWSGKVIELYKPLHRFGCDVMIEYGTGNHLTFTLYGNLGGSNSFDKDGLFGFTCGVDELSGGVCSFYHDYNNDAYVKKIKGVINDMAGSSNITVNVTCTGMP